MSTLDIVEVRRARREAKRAPRVPPEDGRSGPAKARKRLVAALCQDLGIEGLDALEAIDRAISESWLAITLQAEAMRVKQAGGRSIDGNLLSKLARTGLSLANHLRRVVAARRPAGGHRPGSLEHYLITEYGADPGDFPSHPGSRDPSREPVEEEGWARPAPEDEDEGDDAQDEGEAAHVEAPGRPGGGNGGDAAGRAENPEAPRSLGRVDSKNGSRDPKVARPRRRRSREPVGDDSAAAKPRRHRRRVYSDHE